MTSSMLQLLKTLKVIEKNGVSSQYKWNKRLIAYFYSLNRSGRVKKKNTQYYIINPKLFNLQLQLSSAPVTPFRIVSASKSFRLGAVFVVLVFRPVPRIGAPNAWNRP